jgi:hypothetical protein
MNVSIQKKAVRSNKKLSLIDQYLPDVLLIFFILQQFGYSYHISFGSVGLVLMAYLVRNDLSMSSLKIPFLLTLLILLSHLWCLVKYGYNENMLIIFRILLNAYFLFSILRFRSKINMPSHNLMILVTTVICLVAWYQLFIDRSLQVPPDYFAMGENLTFREDEHEYDLYKNKTRTSSIYSEPSYFGMILCSLYALILKSNMRFKFLIIVIIIFTQLMISSGLGIAGTVLITIVIANDISFKDLTYNQILFYIVIGLSVMACWLLLLSFLQKNHFSWAIIERILASENETDASLQVRFIDPFLLIWENFVNFDWLGVPNNTIDHFSYVIRHYRYFPGHNGILNLLIFYGLTGFTILILLSYQLRNPLEWILIIIIGSQNGGFLDYPKVLSLLFVIMALRGASITPKSSGRFSELNRHTNKIVIKYTK